MYRCGHHRLTINYVHLHIVAPQGTVRSTFVLSGITHGKTKKVNDDSEANTLSYTETAWTVQLH